MLFLKNNLKKNIFLNACKTLKHFCCTLNMQNYIYILCTKLHSYMYTRRSNPSEKKNKAGC